jgi:hypothetical protein
MSERMYCFLLKKTTMIEDLFVAVTTDSSNDVPWNLSNRHVCN